MGSVGEVRVGIAVVGSSVVVDGTGTRVGPEFGGGEAVGWDEVEGTLVLSETGLGAVVGLGVVVGASVSEVVVGGVMTVSSTGCGDVVGTTGAMDGTGTAVVGASVLVSPSSKTGMRKSLGVGPVVGVMVMSSSSRRCCFGRIIAGDDVSRGSFE